MTQKTVYKILSESVANRMKRPFNNTKQIKIDVILESIHMWETIDRWDKGST